jgi:hypothetical protein
MPPYRIRKATTDDADKIKKFYFERHKNEISNPIMINRFLDGTTDIDIILIQRVCKSGKLGSPVAACAVFYYYHNGIKYGSCNTGIVNKKMRRKGFSKILYRSCEVLFRANKCQKVMKIRNLSQKHINLDKLTKQNWEITIRGSMVIMEKDL